MAIYRMRSALGNAETVTASEHRRDELIGYGYTEVTTPEKKPPKPRDKPPANKPTTNDN